jgi:hypothetical protein
MRPKRARALRLSLDRLEDRRLLSSTPQGLSPQQLVTAYGLNNLMFSTSALPFPANGTGETIAIIDVDHDPYIYSDLAKYDATFGLSTPGLAGQNQPGTSWFKVVNLAGSTTNDGWAEEEALDVETAHSVAPGANIMVIEAASDNFSDLLYAIQFARATPGVGLVSMSWGQSEFPNEAAYDAYFTTPPGHVGITFVAASGDSPGVEWPASSPNVIGVGGTTLSTTSTGGYLGETAWTSSGGGYSRYEPEPAYQYGVQSSGLRSVPDVAFDANPNTGLSIYATDPSTGLGTWSVFGGTSLGAPAWAGIVAIIDEGYALAHILPSMDGGSLTLPMLYGHSSAGIFHGVTAAAARRFPTTPLTTTGLGTPLGVTFLDSMLGYNVLVTNGATASGAARAVVAAAPVSGSASTSSVASAALAVAPTVATTATPLGPGQGGSFMAVGLASSGRSGGSSRVAVAVAAVSAPTGRVGGTAEPAPGNAPSGPVDLEGNVTAVAVPAMLAATASTVPLPEGPLAFVTTMRAVPIATGLAAPSFLVATDPTTPAPLQNAPPVFDAALRALNDEESFGLA